MEQMDSGQREVIHEEVVGQQADARVQLLGVLDGLRHREREAAEKSAADETLRQRKTGLPHGVESERGKPRAGKQDERVDTTEVRVQVVSGRFEQGRVMKPAEQEEPDQDPKDRNLGRREDPPAFASGQPPLWIAYRYELGVGFRTH